MCNVILKYFALAWRTEIHSYTKKIIHGKYQKKKIWLFEKNFLRRVKKEYLVEEGIGKLYSSKWLIKSWKSKHLSIGRFMEMSRKELMLVKREMHFNKKKCHALEL